MQRRSLSKVCSLPIAAALIGAGCGPTLTVRHLDPVNDRAEVWVNGQQQGVLSYGESLSVDLVPGQHRLTATRPGEVRNLWHKGGGEWRVVVLDDVVLSLLPEPDRAPDDGEPTSP